MSTLVVVMFHPFTFILDCAHKLHITLPCQTHTDHSLVVQGGSEIVNYLTSKPFIINRFFCPFVGSAAIRKHKTDVLSPYKV